MSDLLLLAAVIAGSGVSIALLVLMNRLIGGWRPARLDDAAAVVSAVETAVSSFKAGPEAALDRDGRAGLVCEAGGRRLGLALVLGDRVTARALAPGEVRQVTRQGAQLTLELNDFTLPRARLALGGEEEAERFALHACALVKPGPQAGAQEASHA